MNNEKENNLEENKDVTEDNEEEDDEEDEEEEDNEEDKLSNNKNPDIIKQIKKEENNIQETKLEKNEENIKEENKNDENYNSQKKEILEQKEKKNNIEISINNKDKEEINKENDLNESNDNNDDDEKIENDDIIIPKKTNNNKYIYSTYQNNIFYVDETDDSSPDNYNNSLSINKEESEDKEDNSNSINNTNTEKDSYLLELNDNGIPNIQNDEIISCNINSLINISINNGISISKDICMITNAENEFPSPFYLNSLINEIKIKNEKIPNADYTYNLSIKHQKYLNNLNEDNNILKQLKKYQIFPNRINTKIYFKINCKVSGNITFIFLYKSSQNNTFQFTKPFHILVNPIININNKLLELNQIQMQSVIPKNIGNLEKDFDKYYEHVSLLGYNFIHFHSFQKLSNDENIFLIKDQNDLSDKLFINDANTDIKNINTKQKYQLLLNSIKNLKNKYNIGSMTDIILNQTSSESSWIYANKDCTYNLKNTPWLNAAYELDNILMDYSQLFKNKKVLCKSAPYIYNINDIEEIISEISTYIDKRALEQYFMINEEKYENEFREFYNKLKDGEFKKNFMNKKDMILNDLVKGFDNKEKKLNEIFTDINYIYKLISQCCINYGYERFGVKVCIEFISIIILQSFKEVNKTSKLPSENSFIKDVKSIINIINQHWIKQMVGLWMRIIRIIIRYILTQ